jgi:hypothetical protein
MRLDKTCVVLLWACLLIAAPPAAAQDITDTREGYALLGAAAAYAGGADVPGCPRANGNPFGIRLVIVPRIGDGDFGGTSEVRCQIGIGIGTYRSWKTEQARSGAQWLARADSAALVILERWHLMIRGTVRLADEHFYTPNDLDRIARGVVCQQAVAGWRRLTSDSLRRSLAVERLAR